MSTTYEIPLTPESQTFQISLVGVAYQLTVTWRDAPSGGWFLDIADANLNPIIQGIPLITGADLLAQYRHLPVPAGQLWVATDGNPNAVPTFSNLGITSHLYFTVAG